MAIPQVRQPSMSADMSESQKAEAFRGRKDSLYFEAVLAGFDIAFAVERSL